MKLTLLDLTQNILSALNSDEVNSISDTSESLQVAEIIRTTYFNVLSRAGLFETEEPFQLDASLEVTQPVLMTKPASVRKMEWIKYFDSTKDVNEYRYVTILPTAQFIDLVNGFNIKDTNVDTMTIQLGSSKYTFNYKTDRQPCYCTVLKDYLIIFDSYDSTQDSTLQSSKTMGFGKIIPEFLMEDNFIPELDDQQFPLLLNEAKSLAFFELKQLAHGKAEQESKRQWSTLQKNKSLSDAPSHFDALPNFGRRLNSRNSSLFRNNGWR